MSSYIPQKRGIKLDWFVDNELKQTFENYTHAVEILKIEFNENITEIIIRYLIKKKHRKKYTIFRKIHVYKDNILINIFNKNQEFMDFYNLPSLPYTSRVINGLIKHENLINYEIKKINNIPDIRLHIPKKTDIYRICSYCEISKPLIEQNFNYKNKEKTIYNTRCNECYNKIIGTKFIDKFIGNLNDNWKNHPEYTHLYFERDTNVIFNTLSGKYIMCNPVINNKEILSRNLKWEAFYGKILEHKIVKYKNLENIIKDNDGIELDNLDCVFIYCENCKKLIENPKSIGNIHCSKKCQNIILNNKEKFKRNTELQFYLRQKISIQKLINKKYNTLMDYDIEYLRSLGLKCFYCGLTCKYGYNKENNNPETLSYDKKNSGIGYIKENIVVCCWFCNRMKNQTIYEDWGQFIQFIKNDDCLELDLTNKGYAKKSSEINITNIYWHIKQKSPNYYPNCESAKQTFINQCKQQNYLDPFFQFFPIIYLNTNCLWNASIDAINPSLPKEEKHRPNNLQIVPKCFNYGKNTLSNDEFINEWKLRKFKTDFSKCSIKLPKDYKDQSFFQNNII
jgi:hypothetical protein